MQFGTQANIFVIISSIIPGFVLLSVRSTFIASESFTLEISLLRYLVATAFNYAVWSWLIYYLLYSPISSTSPISSAVYWFLIIFVSPLILGIGSVYATRNDWMRKIAAKFGLAMIHSVPTAWDWQFGRMESPHWVLVTLKNGAQVSGLFGTSSMASPERNVRDIYIEKAYKISQRGPWKEVPGTAGIYVPTDEIRYIEFWTYS